MKWRAFVLAAAVVCLGFSTGIREQTLREAARGSGLLIGTAVRSTQLSEEAYASTLEREFNLVEPEDALKWEVVHPERESFDFSQADRIVDFAARYNMKCAAIRSSGISKTRHGSRKGDSPPTNSRSC